MATIDIFILQIRNRVVKAIVQSDVHEIWTLQFYPKPPRQPHKHGSVYTIVLVILYLWNKKKHINRLKKQMNVGSWFQWTVSWLPSCPCGETEYQVATHLTVAKRQVQKKEAGNQTLQIIPQCFTSSGQAPPSFTVSTPLIMQSNYYLISGFIHRWTK